MSLLSPSLSHLHHQILCQVPFFPCTALAQVEVEGVVWRELYSITQEHTVLHVPVSEEWIPNAQLRVTLAGKYVC